MELAKWQRNAIFRAVVDAGLDPNDCDLSVGGKGSETRITHVPSGSRLILEEEWLQSRGHYTQRYFGSKWISGNTWETRFEASEWSMIEGEISEWSKEVKEDAETPDLWGDLQREEAMFSSAAGEAVANTPFTAQERRELSEQFRSIKAHVADTATLTSEQIHALEAKLDELEAAAERVARKDWQLLLRGAIFSLIVEAVVPPEVVRQVFGMVLRAVDHLFGGQGMPELPGELPPTT